MAKKLDLLKAKVYSLKDCVKILNQSIMPDEEGNIYNIELRENLLECGFNAFSLKSCCSFGSSDTSMLIVGTIEALNDDGNLVIVNKFKKATNVGTKEEPKNAYYPVDLVASFRWTFRDKLARKEEREAEEAKEKKAEAKKQKQDAKKQADKQKEAEKQLKIKLEAEKANREKEDFKKKLLEAKTEAELEAVAKSIPAKYRLALGADYQARRNAIGAHSSKEGNNKQAAPDPTKQASKKPA